MPANTKKKQTRKRPSHKKKQRLGDQAQNFFEATENMINSGEKVIKSFTALDRLIRGNIDKVMGPKRQRDMEDELTRLRRENARYRLFIGSMLEATQEGVYFNIKPDHQNFDIVEVGGQLGAVWKS